MVGMDGKTYSDRSVSGALTVFAIESRVAQEPVCFSPLCHRAVAPFMKKTLHQQSLRHFYNLPLFLFHLRYILSIENEEAIREYVVDLLEGTEGKKKHFVDELVVRWRRSCQPTTSDPLSLYRKKDGKWEQRMRQ